MTDDDHDDLIECALSLEGPVVIGHYEAARYLEAFHGWQVHRTESRISAGRGGALRTECVWLNPQCVDALRSGRGDLFAEHAA